MVGWISREQPPQICRLIERRRLVTFQEDQVTKADRRLNPEQLRPLRFCGSVHEDHLLHWLDGTPRTHVHLYETVLGRFGYSCTDAVSEPISHHDHVRDLKGPGYCAAVPKLISYHDHVRGPRGFLRLLCPPVLLSLPLWALATTDIRLRSQGLNSGICLLQQLCLFLKLRLEGRNFVLQA